MLPVMEEPAQSLVDVVVLGGRTSLLRAACKKQRSGCLDLLEIVTRMRSSDAVHLSAKRRVAGAGARVALGAGDADPGAYWVTDGPLVAAAAARLADPTQSTAT